VLIGLLETMRPRQWPKNGLVFVALFFDGKVTDPVSLARTVAAFVLLCFMSGAIYIILRSVSGRYPQVACSPASRWRQPLS
jgi:Na+-transporting NADH:ubiquinone oxidoreductase subunit NqrB